MYYQSICCFFFFFFFKQKTAYEMRISDWSSDVCSSDLFLLLSEGSEQAERVLVIGDEQVLGLLIMVEHHPVIFTPEARRLVSAEGGMGGVLVIAVGRSEEHTSELQSLMRNSYAVFCLENKKQPNNQTTKTTRDNARHHIINE